MLADVLAAFAPLDLVFDCALIISVHFAGSRFRSFHDTTNEFARPGQLAIFLFSHGRSALSALGELKSTATTKGAPLCPQDQPQRAGTAQRVGVQAEALAVATRCGWCSAHSRAPKNRRGSRRFPRNPECE